MVSVSVSCDVTRNCKIGNTLTPTPAYTTFEYSSIAIDSSVTAGPAVGEIVPGGPSELFDTVATVTATITNTGDVAGAGVAQLYVSYPEPLASSTPPRQLRGFDKISLAPGESSEVVFELRWRDLSYWDVDTDNWVIPSGEFGVFVSASSRDQRLEGTITAA